MTLLLDQHFDRTLDALLALGAACPPNPAPIRIDAWLFEDLPARARPRNGASFKPASAPVSAAPTNRWSISSWKKPLARTMSPRLGSRATHMPFPSAFGRKPIPWQACLPPPR